MGHQEDNGTNRAESAVAGEEKAFSHMLMPVIIEGSQEETVSLKNKQKAPVGNLANQEATMWATAMPVKLDLSYWHLPSLRHPHAPEEPEEPGGVRREDRNACNLSPADC